ncbi:MAG: 2-hydroxyacid dehydrogenase, partial [Pseudomonadota bacterium]
MTTQILAVADMLEVCMPALETSYRVHKLYASDDPAAMVRSVGPHVRAIATDGTNGVSNAVIDACPQARMIASFGVGYDKIDIAHCKDRGIKVTNTPDVLNDGVAELTQALMLALCRRIPQTDRYVRDGRWPAEGNYRLTGELTGAT